MSRFASTLPPSPSTSTKLKGTGDSATTETTSADVSEDDADDKSTTTFGSPGLPSPMTSRTTISSGRFIITIIIIISFSHYL